MSITPYPPPPPSPLAASLAPGRVMTDRTSGFIPWVMRPGRIYGFLLILVGVQFVVGVMAPMIHDRVAVDGIKHIMNKFNPMLELNLPTWFASVLLLTAGGLAGAITDAQRRLAFPTHGRRWFLLTMLLLLASVDEVASLHEMLGPLTNRFVETSGFFDNAWMLPAGVGVLVLIGVFLPWLRALPRRTAGLFALGCAVFVSGAMVFEGLGSLVLEAYGPTHPAYAGIVSMEEALEAAGTCTIIFAFLDYLQHTVPGWTIRLQSKAEE